MNHLKRGWFFSIHMIHKHLIKCQNFLKIRNKGLGTSNNYCEWLGQHESCYDINTWPSLLEFIKSSNAWLSIWKAWASILNTRQSDWKAWPDVLKQRLCRVFTSIVTVQFFVLMNFRLMFFLLSRWFLHKNNCNINVTVELK